MVKEFIARVLSARNEAHLEHWNTRSYAQHKALQDFYEGVLDLLDSFVESYQGNFGIIEKIKISCSDEIDTLACIESDLAWFEENADEITKEVCALENILDEIVGVYLQTRYKLKNLS